MRLGSQPVVLAPGHRCPIVTSLSENILFRSLSADCQFVRAPLSYKRVYIYMCNKLERGVTLLRYTMGRLAFNPWFDPIRSIVSLFFFVWIIEHRRDKNLLRISCESLWLDFVTDGRLKASSEVRL